MGVEYISCEWGSESESVCVSVVPHWNMYIFHMLLPLFGYFTALKTVCRCQIPKNCSLRMQKIRRAGDIKTDEQKNGRRQRRNRTMLQTRWWWWWRKRSWQCRQWREWHKINNGENRKLSAFVKHKLVFRDSLSIRPIFVSLCVAGWIQRRKKLNK